MRSSFWRKRRSTPAALAQAMNVDRSTALRLLRQLQATGYVARDDLTRCYAVVGARFMRLVSSAPDHADLSELVDPVLRAVRTQHGEASLLAVPARGSMVYAAFFPSHQLLTVREQLGAVRPMHCSAVGKAYLSGLNAASIREGARRAALRRRNGACPGRPAGALPPGGRGPAARLRRRPGRDVRSASAASPCPLWIGDSLIGAIGVTGPSTRSDCSRSSQSIGPELGEAAADLRTHPFAAASG